MIKLNNDEKESLAEFVKDPHSYDVCEDKVVDDALAKTQYHLKDGLELLTDSLPEFFRNYQEVVRSELVKNIERLMTQFIEETQLRLSYDEPDTSLEVHTPWHEEGLYKCSFKEALADAALGSSKDDALRCLKSMKEDIEQLESELSK